MTRIPKEDRLQFYRFRNACTSFEEVEHICEYMQKEQIDPSHYLFYPLTLSIAVIYGRPFKQKKNIRLPELMIPKELQSTHEFLLLIRDKVFAHTDIDGPRYDEDFLANEIVVDARAGRVEYSLTTLAFRDTEIKKIRRLSRILAEKSGYHAEKLWNKYIGKRPFPDGEYKVNLADGNGPLLVPSKH